MRTFPNWIPKSRLCLKARSTRIRNACCGPARPSYDLTREQVRTARQAYFANISYVDEKIGTLLDVIERCGMTDDTIVVFTSDHGDMLGERGLWFKMSFFDGSARVR